MRKKACADGGRDWNDAVTRQEMASNVGIHQKLGRAKEESLLEPPEGAWPDDTFISDL